MTKNSTPDNLESNNFDLKPVAELAETIKSLNSLISAGHSPDKWQKAIESLSGISKQLGEQHIHLGTTGQATALLLDQKLAEQKKSLSEFNAEVAKKIAEFAKLAADIRNSADLLSAKKGEVDSELQKSKEKIANHLNEQKIALERKTKELDEMLLAKKLELEEHYKGVVEEKSRALEAQKNKIESIIREFLADHNDLHESIKKKMQIAEERKELTAQQEVLDSERKKLYEARVKLQSDIAGYEHKIASASTDDLPTLKAEVFRLNKEIAHLRNELEQSKDEHVTQLTELAESSHQGRMTQLESKKLHDLEEYVEQADKVIELLGKKSSVIEAQIVKIDRLIGQYSDKKSQGKPYEVLINIKNEFKPKRYIPAAVKLADVKELVDHVLGFALCASNHESNTRYIYSREDICAFVAGLAQVRSRLTILQGVSGTGKTSLPKIFSQAIGMEESCKVIPVQPNWRDRHELIGFYNEFQNRYNVSPFTKAVYQSTLDLNSLWLVILDEMNLARIEYYFADFLSSLEGKRKDWRVTLWDGKIPSGDDCLPADRSDDSFNLQENVFFIGTANEDESTNEITDKVYDRANVIAFSSKVSNGAVAGIREVSAQKVTPMRDLNAMIQKALSVELSQNADYLEVEAKRKDTIEMYMGELGVHVGYRFEEQIATYYKIFVAGGATLQSALDYFCSIKYLRKLKNLRIPEDGERAEYVKMMHSELKDYPRCQGELKKIFPEILKKKN